MNINDTSLFFRGFNHGTYEVSYQGAEKPTAEWLEKAVSAHVNSETLFFQIGQAALDRTWDNWRRGQFCDFSLVVLRKDGRSYLHG